MNYILTAEKAKNQAKLLAIYLESIKRKVPHGNALEAVAAMYGKKSWNVLSSEIDSVGESENMSSNLGDMKFFASVVNSQELRQVELTVDAEMHTDDQRREASFNAITWFQQASEAEILGLAAIDWSNDREADEVAEFCRNKRLNDDLNSVFDYHEGVNEDRSMYEDPLGYEVSVSEVDALKYLRAFRYDIFVKLLVTATYGGLNSSSACVSEDSDQPGKYYFNTVMDASDISYDSETDAYIAMGYVLENYIKYDEIGYISKEKAEEIWNIEPESGKVTGAPAQTSSDTEELALNSDNRVPGRFDETTGTGKILVLDQKDGHLSHKTLRAITDNFNFRVQIAVPVSLDTLIDSDIDGVNDYVSEMITGNSGDLSDLNFESYRPSDTATVKYNPADFFILVTAEWDPMDGFGDDNA